MTDETSLDRFLTAQETDYDDALAELQRGLKESHWMWYIFPQLRGLGRSRRSWFFGIEDADEARRYATHPVLGPRLVEATEAVLGNSTLTAEAIMGEIDAQKLRSSATLFRAAAPDPAPFEDLLDTFFESDPCPRTLKRLGPMR